MKMMIRPLVAVFIFATVAPHWACAAAVKASAFKQRKTAAAARPSAAPEEKKEETPHAATAEEEEEREDKKAPLNITSERMVSEKKSNKISFYGSVVAIKGRLRVTADEMYVFSDKTQEHLQEMEAIGSVRITHKDKVATGGKAVYYEDSQMLVLTENPILTQGKNVATGEKVIYHLDREDMEIISGPNKPATVTLFPKTQKDKSPEPATTPPSVER
jgi:lipopolysaccharide export system protein LptA